VVERRRRDRDAEKWQGLEGEKKNEIEKQTVPGKEMFFERNQK